MFGGTLISLRDISPLCMRELILILRRKGGWALGEKETCLHDSHTSNDQRSTTTSLFEKVSRATDADHCLLNKDKAGREESIDAVGQ